MHEITGDREAVQKLMKDTVQQLETTANGAAAARAPGTRSRTASTTRAARSEKVDPVLDVWREALAHMETGTGGRTAARAAGIGSRQAAPGRAVATPYAPRDQRIALFQSAMDEYLDSAAKGAGPAAAKSAAMTTRAASASKPRKSTQAASLDAFYAGGRPGKAAKAGGTSAAADLMAKFSPLDPRWVEVVVEKAKLLLKGKHPFVAHQSATDFRFTMNNETTIAIVGDWGGGNEAAQAVAKQIAKLAPDHVIHLGDVYYAGTPNEVQERFLKYWPTPGAPGRSFALNSNHEMYSGGYGYFDYTLKKFAQPASYFSLANDNWCFIGLDTGYDEHELHAPQAEWLRQQLAVGGRKNVLMSHHQLFSAYESTDASKLRATVQPFLAQVYGWIWGHEHLAVIYAKHDGINAICLGNGCFPYDFPSTPPTVPVKWIDKRTTSDSDYPGGHTFALLRIKGPRIDMDLIDEIGAVGWSETWV